MARGTDIPDMRALITNLKQHSGVRIFEVTEEEIFKSSELVPPSLKPVPGTMSVHQVNSHYTERLSEFVVFLFVFSVFFFFSSLQSSLSRKQAASGSETSPASAKIGVTASLQENLDFPVCLTMEQKRRKKTQMEAQLKLGHGFC